MVGDSWRSMLLCAAGTEPFELVEHAVAVAGSMSGGAKPRIAKQLPASLDTFGWCTWDAYYSTVSAQGTICCISYATFFHVHASACMCNPYESDATWDTAAGVAGPCASDCCMQA